MSATSPASDDLNSKRDFEYADDEFLIEPEISFSPSTESKAEPQRGHEAEGRFTSGAEASFLTYKICSTSIIQQTGHHKDH